MTEQQEEKVEERDLIDTTQADRHIFGAECPCGPSKINVKLENGTRDGIVWKHGHLDG